jgi:hypothetical protein
LKDGLNQHNSQFINLVLAVHNLIDLHPDNAAELIASRRAADSKRKTLWPGNVF